MAVKTLGTAITATAQVDIGAVNLPAVIELIPVQETGVQRVPTSSPILVYAKVLTGVSAADVLVATLTPENPKAYVAATYQFFIAVIGTTPSLRADRITITY